MAETWQYCSLRAAKKVGQSENQTPATGFEPVTCRLTAGRSAVELRGNGKEIVPKHRTSVNRDRVSVRELCIASCFSDPLLGREGHATDWQHFELGASDYTPVYGMRAALVWSTFRLTASGKLALRNVGSAKVKVLQSDG